LIKGSDDAAANVGAFSSAFEGAGGLGKIFGGFVVDWFSPTAVLVGSLAVSGGSHALLIVVCLVAAAANAGAGSASVSALSLVWGLNGLAQSFAWPAIARVFMAFFPDPRARGKWYALLATSQNIGAAVAPVLLMGAAGLRLPPGWAQYTQGAALGAVPPQWLGLVALPGLLALIVAFLVMVVVSDAPAAAPTAASAAACGPEPPALNPLEKAAVASVSATPRRRKLATAPSTPAASLPSSEATGAAAPTAETAPAAPGASAAALGLGETLAAVLGAAPPWLLGVNYFFNTFLRNGFTEVPVWLLGPAGLAVPPAALALAVGAYEAGAAAGGLAAGWVSDNCFGGRRGPAIALFSFAAAPVPLVLAALLGPLRPPSNTGEATDGSDVPLRVPAIVLAYAMLGFLAFGPHVLNGLAAREYADPRVQSTAGGFSKALGQLGGTAAGLPLGLLLAACGWRTAMLVLAAASVAAGVAALPLWRTQPFAAVPPRQLEGRKQQ